MEWHGLNSSGSGYKQVVGCSENNNEIWVPKNKGKLLTSWEAISFSRTLLNGQLEYLGPTDVFVCKKIAWQQPTFLTVISPCRSAGVRPAWCGVRLQLDM